MSNLNIRSNSRMKFQALRRGGGQKSFVRQNGFAPILKRGVFVTEGFEIPNVELAPGKIWVREGEEIVRPGKAKAVVCEDARFCDKTPNSKCQTPKNSQAANFKSPRCSSW